MNEPVPEEVCTGPSQSTGTSRASQRQQVPGVQ
ncbi:hypothetical protein SFR_3380 [Streptomyces sp. FR-008]|nr:hypothetical protein SFR_3380 [Streptomyces sp. FR-008]